MVIPGPRSNSALSGASSTIFFNSLRRKRFIRVRPAVSVVAPMDQIREKTNRPSIILMGSLGATCRKGCLAKNIITALEVHVFVHVHWCRHMLIASCDIQVQMQMACCSEL